MFIVSAMCTPPRAGGLRRRPGRRKRNKAGARGVHILVAHRRHLRNRPRRRNGIDYPVLDSARRLDIGLEDFIHSFIWNSVISLGYQSAGILWFLLSLVQHGVEWGLMDRTALVGLGGAIILPR